ncbi:MULTISPECIES: Wzz/FepE/Etk N-terminal domain-containing protein [Vibrio harveyi group]|uniref:Regulator of length of O-antigen component of lipopolysaccharide chains n=1 Tax=Vibrio parahaemolyticus TaxID=670 RepID=A0A5P5X5I3_VIBPH|nr:MULTISPECIES: Wzz/FepE/Etk N-terminal domain-containing protein [Vibrio harveyi group]EKO3846176.1 LPS O-antigen length regulator [Vibrio harveyi]QFF90436.1 regulator of length of O-antigen component of lipopolysaccharide chains [Vibrio parahaemolyticus]QOS17606.1 ferric enterobactin transport protein FepE [Vibrio parahaemolyticus]QOS19079.1 ferric enterobactin transport protein FepE [Vibrio parahaemolyticus]QOS19492.1 ferric enterobactin transport protein FepE [Vibrio parahaemolyticus]
MEPQKESNPNYLPYPPQSTDDEIDLRELFNALWKGKWIIIVTIFVFAVGSVLYALSLPNIYKSDALLAPAESSNGGGLSKMAGQLGGLAALAGVNLGAGESSQTDLAVQVMKSRQFVETFINKHDLLVPLMAAKDWDLANNKLILNEELYNSNTGEWLREPNGLRGVTPTAQEAFEVFSKEVMSVSQDKESGLYTISVKHYSPYVAQQWVNWLIEDINKVMRERTIAETSQNLAYLNTQLQKTAVADMQSTFYKLIEEQTKSLMLAEVQEEFIFKVVDPAVAPELKDGPKRALICVLGTLLGGILGVAIVLVRFAFRKEDI